MKKATGILICSGLGLGGGIGAYEVAYDILPSDAEFAEMHHDVHECAEALPNGQDNQARVLPVSCQQFERDFNSNKDPVRENTIHLPGTVLDKTTEKYILPSGDEFRDANLPKIEERERFQDRAQKIATALGAVMGMAFGYNAYQASRLKADIKNNK